MIECRENIDPFIRDHVDRMNEALAEVARDDGEQPPPFDKLLDAAQDLANAMAADDDETSLGLSLELSKAITTMQRSSTHLARMKRGSKRETIFGPRWLLSHVQFTYRWSMAILYVNMVEALAEIGLTVDDGKLIEGSKAESEINATIRAIDAKFRKDYGRPVPRPETVFEWFLFSAAYCEEMFDCERTPDAGRVRAKFPKIRAQIAAAIDLGLTLAETGDAKGLAKLLKTVSSRNRHAINESIRVGSMPQTRTMPAIADNAARMTIDPILSWAGEGERRAAIHLALERLNEIEIE